MNKLDPIVQVRLRAGVEWTPIKDSKPPERCWNNLRILKSRRGAFWLPWAFEKYYSRVLVREPAREERQRIVRSAYEIAPTLEQAWRSFARPEENLLSNVQKIKCPVFLAWAKNDFVLPLKALEPSFSQFRHHRLEIFDGGHAAFLEDPEQFELSLRRFLSSMQNSSAAPVAQPGS